MVSSPDFNQLRVFFFAFGHPCRASGVKPTAGWGIDGACSFAGKGKWRFALLNFGIRQGDCGKQAFGVRMLMRFVQNIRVSELYDFSQIQHRNIVADKFHHAQIMGDEQTCEMKFLL